MRVQVHVRGAVDEATLWPYVAEVESRAGDSLLAVDVTDSRELVGVLVALTDRGLDIVNVETSDAALLTPTVEETGRDR